jgi:hypothetical protein
MPHELRYDLFETAANSGHPQAIKFLQRAVGEHDDGILGARTLQAALSVNPVRMGYGPPIGGSLGLFSNALLRMFHMLMTMEGANPL